MLRRHGYLQRLAGYSSFLVERVVDLFVVAMLALVGMVLQLKSAPYAQGFLYGALAMIVLATVAGGFLLFKIDMTGRVGEFLRELRGFGGRKLMSVVLLTLCCWITVAIGWQICLWSLPIEIGFQDAVALTSIMTVVNVLSMIPGALGISEAGIAQILTQFGHAPVAAQAGAILVRFYGLLIIVLGLAHLVPWNRSLATLNRE
jgi:uncharacterized membrane protein YbhN (UPF0104 family)